MSEIVDYSPPPVPESLDLDFLEGKTLEELEDGIRGLAAATDVLALVQGCAILKIEREGLWIGSFPTLRDYRAAQHDRLGLSPASISDRRRMAEAWIEHRRVLSKLKLAGHVGKLVFFEAAAELHGPADAARALKEKTWRDYRAYSKPRKKKALALPDVSMSVRGGVISLNGEALLTVSEELAGDEVAFITATLKAAYQARWGNLLAHVVPVYDSGEARAVDNFLKKRRAET